MPRVDALRRIGQGHRRRAGQASPHARQERWSSTSRAESIRAAAGTGSAAHPADAGTDISAYKNLIFWAKVTGDTKPSQLSMTLRSSDKTASEKDDLLQRCPDLLDGKWHEVVIPIKDLDSKNALNKAKVWEIQIDTWSQDEVEL